MMYCGCETRCNKFNWFLFGVALFIALVGTGFTLYFYIHCVAIEYYDCMDNVAKQGDLQRDEISANYLDYERWFSGKFGESGNPAINVCEENLKNCAYPWILISFFGGILFYIIAVIPLFVMCCCAPIPKGGATNDKLPVIAEEKIPLKFQDGWTFQEPLLEKKDADDVKSFPVVFNDIDTSADV